MGSLNRRRYLIIGVGGALVASGVAVGMILIFSGSSAAAPTKAEYFARVAAICRIYGPQLDKIVPPDVSEPANVMEAVSRALPIVKAQIQAVRALATPAELRSQLAHWFKLHDLRIAKLEDAVRAARRLDLTAMSFAYVEFMLAAPKVARLGTVIGIPHPPC